MSRQSVVARREIAGEVVMEEWVSLGRSGEGYWRTVGAGERRTRGVVVAAVAMIVATVLGAGGFVLLDAATSQASQARPAQAAPPVPALGQVAFRVSGPEPAGPGSVRFRVEVSNEERAPVILTGARQRLLVDTGNAYAAAETVLGLRAGERGAADLTFTPAPGERPTGLVLTLGDRRLTVPLRNPVDGRRYSEGYRR